MDLGHPQTALSARRIGFHAGDGKISVWHERDGPGFIVAGGGIGEIVSPAQSSVGPADLEHEPIQAIGRCCGAGRDVGIARGRDDGDGCGVIGESGAADVAGPDDGASAGCEALDPDLRPSPGADLRNGDNVASGHHAEGFGAVGGCGSGVHRCAPVEDGCGF